MGDTFDHAVERMVAKNAHFKKEAYYFLNEALGKAMQKAKTKGKLSEPGHVNAASLSLAFQELALERYGGLSKHVLNHWGIHCSEDIGGLVYKLVEDGIWSKTEEDSIKDFTNLIDFDAVFLDPFLAPKTEHDGRALKTPSAKATVQDSIQKKTVSSKAAKHKKPSSPTTKQPVSVSSALKTQKKPSASESSLPSVSKKNAATQAKKHPTKKSIPPKRKKPKN